MEFPKTEKELEIYFALKDLEKARDWYLNPPLNAKVNEYEEMNRYSKAEEEYLKLANQ